MATAHLHRVLVVAADARKAALATWISNNVDPGQGANWLAVGLSPSGAAPATHWWFSVALTNAQGAAVLNRWYALAGMTPPAWGAMTRAQIRTRLAADR